MILKLITNPLTWIFIVALFIRTYNLDKIPGGFHVDEVKVGWNAYSILKTGADDWGNKWPLHYNSFGDYRPTGIIYLTIPTIAVFGLSEFSVRLPGALFGSLTVISLYYLTGIIGNKHKNVKVYNLGGIKLNIAHFASIMLALSPWHINLSRATSEGIITLFLIITGISFLGYAIKKSDPKKIFIALLLLLVSYFFYHSARLLTPVIAFISTVYFLKNIKKFETFKYIFLLILTLILATFVFASMSEARGRFNQVSVFNDLDIKTAREEYPFEDGQNNVLIARIFHNKLVLYTTNFIEEYARYFSADFLIGDSAKPIRYITPDHGVMMYIEAFLLMLGIAAIIRKKHTSLAIALLLISPLPAALTTEDAPNLHRAIFMIPFLSIITAYGINSLNRLLILPTTILLLLNFTYFAHLYFVHNPVHEPIPINRNVGVKDAINFIQSKRSEYDLIYLTNIPDSLYPWFAFYTKADPKDFNELAKRRDKGAWQYQNIMFGEIKCPSKDVNPNNYEGKKILLMDSEGCDSNVLGNIVKIKKEIKRYRGGVTYTFWDN